MTEAGVKPSSRLQGAASAEREHIARSRTRLAAQRTRLLAELADLDASLAVLDERELLLDRLVSSPAATDDDLPKVAEPEPGIERDSSDAKERRLLLRGPSIREAAVELLARSPRSEAIHYREWYEMVLAAGFEVAGKDPAAVFLTQISRSPVVRKSTHAGVYSLDIAAPARIQRKLAALETALRNVTSEGSADFGQVRARREQVFSEIRKTERDLAEAERVLGRQQLSQVAVR